MVGASASLRVTRTLESLTPPAVLAPVAAGVPSGITPAQLEITHLFCLN